MPVLPQRARRSTLPGRPSRTRQRLLVSALFVLGVLAGGPQPAVAASTPEFFGTNLHNLSLVAQPSRGAVLDYLRDSRMTVHRVQVEWPFVEPNPPRAGSTGCSGRTYNWSVPDQVIESMARRNLRAAPLFRYTPQWARIADPSKPGGRDEFPPSSYDDFGCMIAAFARRYGDPPGPAVGEFWAARPSLPFVPTQLYELWNEVNLAEYAWNRDPNPEAYAAMIKVVAPMVRAAVPGSLVLGDLAYQESEVPDYVPRLARAGGLAQLDGMGYHPYAPEAEGTLRLVQHMRRQLVAAGFPAMPIFANEAGQEAVVTNPDGSLTPNRPPSQFGYLQFPSDAARAANLAFAGEALAQSDCGVEQFLPYTVSGSERSGQEPGEKLTEAYMGLFRSATGAPTLTAEALRRASLRWAQRFDAGGPGIGERLRLCSDAPTVDAALLTIDSRMVSNARGCMTLSASYDGNPLEAVSLRLISGGREVAQARTSAFGEATACIPYGVPVDRWEAIGVIDDAGRTGIVRCDVAGVGCPVGQQFVPGRGTVSATHELPKAALPPATCTWRAQSRVVAFTPARGSRAARARLRVKVLCETAPAKEQVRFTILARQPGKKKPLRRVRTVWLKNGVERALELRGRFVNGHIVVVQHRPRAGSKVPAITNSVTLRVKRKSAVGAKSKAKQPAKKSTR